MNIGLPVQGTDFTLDVLGRYVCNTYEEARASADPAFRAAATDANGNPLPQRGDLRPFDFVVIGGGTFGAAVAEHLWYRSAGRSERILVLEAGPFLLPEHQQNLPALGIGREVWGRPWNGNVAFPDGLYYAVGGRSLVWGGWSPRPLAGETPAPAWPQAVLDDLNAATLPDGSDGYFRQASEQIGVTATNDFIFGDLHVALRQRLFAIIEAGLVSDAIPLAALPDAPAIEIRDAPPALDDLADLLGITLPQPLPATPAEREQLAADLRNQVKLEAPLAVQGHPEHAGFFPLSKFSTVPLLIKAAREAVRQSGLDDVRKRLMVVPRCHVTRLGVVDEPDGRRVVEVQTERGPIPVTPDAKVIVALGTIESSRFALLSFGADGRIGTNLTGHLRSNVDFRIGREALATLSPAVKALQSSALFVKGHHRYTRPDGQEDGTVGHFHLQITASGLNNVSPDSEAELWQTVPDLDTVEQHLHATDSRIVITIRAIGEMEANNPSSNVTLDLNPAETDFGERKAYVNLTPTVKDMQLWEAMDAASDQLAAALADGHPIDVIARHPTRVTATNVAAATLAAELPHTPPNAANPTGRRDGLGTTHHEAGTLRMGTDSVASVTDPNARFHGVKNAYAVGPALFPTAGSPNPMLPGIALARRLGDHLLPPPSPAPADKGIRTLFDGTQSADAFFRDWLMAGGGSFRIVGRSLVAQPGNSLGLLYYVAEQFDDFTLRLDVCLPHPRGGHNDNSGVFVRFRDPRQPVPQGAPGPSLPGNPATVAIDTGYEVQIDEEARGDRRINEADGFFFNRTGAIYKVTGAGSVPGQQEYVNRQHLAPSAWHTLEIAVKDRTYRVRLNGQAATTFTADPADPAERFRGRKQSEDPASGFIGLQAHTGTVAFANIRVRS